MVRWLTTAFAARWTGALMVLTLAFPATAENSSIVNRNRDGIAIRGYDTVAYFTESRAMKGTPEFEYIWQDARWLFANAEHRDLFARDPERYAPRFGGFCTGGMALNYIQEPNPENWLIVDGQLYLHHSKPSRDRQRENPEPVISAAEANWVTLRKQDDPAARRPCKTCPDG